MWKEEEERRRANLKGFAATIYLNGYLDHM